MASQKQKAETFQRMHDDRETFAIPNPWDSGSALALQEAGFKALATTSSGFAQTLGKRDGELTLEEKLDHCRILCAVTDVPISADFEHGFSDTPAEAAENFLRLAETGVAGGSIEDFSREKIYDLGLAVDKVQACAEALSSLEIPFTLTARAEGLLREDASLDAVIHRLLEFEKAGADVLYAPALRSLDAVREVLAAVSKPVNVLAPFLPGVSLAQYQELGVARVSVGGALARQVQKFTLEAASRMFESS